MTLYERIMAAEPCYPSERVRELVDAAERDGLLKTLGTIPPSDARWVLSRLMTEPQLVEWARASAKRARGYARAAARHAADDHYADADAVAFAAGCSANYAARNAAYYADAAENAAAVAAGRSTMALHAAVGDAAYYAARAASHADADTEHHRLCEHALELLFEAPHV